MEQKKIGLRGRYAKWKAVGGNKEKKVVFFNSQTHETIIET